MTFDNSIFVTFKKYLMKHFSLKFKLSRCVILKYLVLKFAIFGIIIPLNGFAQGASSELTKEIDFSSAVTRITQKYDIGVFMHAWSL